MSTEKKLKNDWSTANQQYLAGSLNVIKTQLEWYKKSTSGQQEKQEPAEYFLQIAELKKDIKNMAAPPAIEQIVDVLGLSAFERDVLLLCAGVELDSSFGDLVQSMQGDSSMLPSFSLALAGLPASHWTAIAPGGPLRYWRLIEISKTQLVARSPLRIDEHILHYLAGVRELHERLKEIASRVNESEYFLPSQLNLADEIFNVFYGKGKKYSSPPVIQLQGPDNSDKLNIAAKVSSRLGFELYAIAVNVMPSSQHDLYELTRLWNREAALNGYALFLDCENFDSSDRLKTLLLNNFIEDVYGLVIVSGNWSPQLKKPKFIFDVAKPAPSEQLVLWKTMSGAANNNEQFENLVSQFNLSASTIAKIGEDIFYTSGNGFSENENKNHDEKKLWQLCCDYTRPEINELAERIEPLADWGDIVLPEEQKTMLKAIASQVKQRNKVYEKWGFAKKISRGLGISVLFAGESGTGKTMAAEVLANDLHLDLYKIDLSKVVNKYIGETEKNLKKIFDAAEDGGAILLFDEADALFGKRSEVKDSHDRYSNIEVSYLLQRMEAYRGLAILTTNMRSALDKAFLRRIRFVIQFPFPDAELRTEIWKKIFPQGVKHNLDLEKLSRLSLPGGSIRNIALNAAFFAANDGDEVLMSHVSRAAKAEYDKMEKTFSSVELKR